MRTARVRLPLERRKISVLDIVEAIAILTVFAALTLSAHAQASQGVQPAGGDPTQISISHDRTALPTAMSTGRSLLDSTDIPRVEHGEQSVMEYAPPLPRLIPLGTIARSYREGRPIETHEVWYPWSR